MSTILFGDESAMNLEGKSPEWYTPSRYVESARLVMGGIDLDPASCKIANTIVKAAHYYTKEDNGLDHPWHGRVFLNPPYGRTVKMAATRKSTIALFVEKLLESYQSGDVEQAIVLATTEVNAKWFYPLLSYPICFPPEKNERGVYSQMFGTCFAYLGPYTERFIEVFQQFGHVVQSVAAPPSVRVKQSTLWMGSEEAV